MRYRSRPRAERLGILALLGLVGLAVAYLGTVEPAPTIGVRWRDDVSAARQGELERRHLLVDGEPRQSDAPSSLSYTLLDISRRNLEAIVKDPEIADTSAVDRERYEVMSAAARGERRTWVAYRVPGLRQATVLRTLIAVLVVIAIAGLPIVAAVRRLIVALGSGARRVLWVLYAGRKRIAALRDGLRRDSGDVFDTIASRLRLLAPPSRARPGNDAARFLVKTIAGGMVVVAIGVPIVDTWEALFLAASVLALIFGVPTSDPRRLGAAAVVVIAVMAMKAGLPRADIAEAHNAFLVLHEGEPLERGLPSDVFRSWKVQFDALYPPEIEPYPQFSWRAHATLPTSLFTQSADAIWRRPKYTRQVDTIDFQTLGEFRGGFSNDMLYNFWAGDVSRQSMPFYAMYQLTPASAGSRVTWMGQVFWERADGRFEEIIHRQVAAKVIESEDAGKRVYAAFFPQRDHQLHFRIEPSLKLRFAAWIATLLTLAGVVSVLTLTVRPRLGAYLRALSIFSAAYVMAWLVGGEYLGGNYAPHGGGDDGLVNDGWGRAMAMLAGHGEIAEAFKGNEAVYWFTPGMRYLRMVEKLIFGDTNHLYLLLLAILPIGVFYLIRHFSGIRWAWVVAAMFCVMPVGNLSFLQNITNAGIGYGEAGSGALFLLALAMLLRTQPSWGGRERNLAITAIAGATLAASMFIRPNFAIAVVWLGAAYTFSSARRNDRMAIVALAAGLSLALWMPLHNWYYGGEFYLISKSGSTIVVTLGVRDYFSALLDVLRGRLHTQATDLIGTQLRGWLSGPGFVYREWLTPLAWAAHGFKLLALAVTCGVVVRWAASGFVKDTALAVVAVAALCAHAPMLFLYSTYDRYAMLGWDLALVVLLVSVCRARETAPLSAVRPDRSDAFANRPMSAA